MKTIQKLIIVVLFSFLTLVGCSTKEAYYTLQVYEKEPIEKKLEEAEKVKEVDQYLQSIMKEEESVDAKDIDIPKSFSYVISKNDDEQYQLVSGYLFYDNDCYTIEDYDNKIREVKRIFGI